MVRWLMTLLILVLMAQAATAAVDPRPDVLGVYFDDAGNLTCKDDRAPSILFSVWLVYTNPSVPHILGFEAGYHTTATFLQVAIHPPCLIVNPVEPELDNLFYACGEPIPTAAAMPLFSIDYLYLGSEPWESSFHLEKARDSVMPGNNPHIILPDGTPMEAQAGAVAYTTLFCTVATEDLNWGSVKSLYR